MRAFRLATVTLEAERVRLELMGRRLAVSALLCVLAGVLLLYALAAAHVLGWLALEPHLPPMGRAGVLLGVDLGLAVILVLVALRSRPGPAEVEARILRDTAYAQAKSSLGFFPLLTSVTKGYGLTLLLSFLRRGKK